jgi:hypothetical protein
MRRLDLDSTRRTHTLAAASRSKAATASPTTPEKTSYLSDYHHNPRGYPKGTGREDTQAPPLTHYNATGS